MSYSYYCVECGEHLEAGDISFDLTELTGIREIITNGRSEMMSAMPIKPGMARVQAKALVDSAVSPEGGRISVRDGNPIRVEWSLLRYLENIAVNCKGRAYREKVSGLKISNLRDDPSTNLLYKVLDLDENDTYTRKDFDTFVGAMLQVFTLKGGATNERDLDNFICEFTIRPEFLSDGSGIYTIKYMNRVTDSWQDVSYGGAIRGYCPRCGGPVLSGCGEHEHVLVGLLGAQSAGKTSTIIAMLDDIKNHFSELGVRYPVPIPLYDKRFMVTRRNFDLYRQGWAVNKTDIDNAYSKFNASILVEAAESASVGKLLTFVDIAGEVLYDKDKGGLNVDAMKSYPLIDKCDLYVVCSCARADDLDVPPDAITNIAREIYILRKHQSPMCIMLTKADQYDARQNGIGDTADSAEGRDRGVIDRIVPAGNYAYAIHLNGFKNASKSGNNEERAVVEWCGKTYREFQTYSFVTMLYSAAYGYSAKLYDGDINSIPDSHERPRPVGIDDLWRWVLTLTGLVRTAGGYRFLHIPEMSERPEDSRYYIALKSQFLNPVEEPPAKISEENTGASPRRKPTSSFWDTLMDNWWLLLVFFVLIVLSIALFFHFT